MAAPSSFVCSITCDLMERPVVASDGHSYEGSAMQQWLDSNSTSPMTNAQLPNRTLVPNIALRHAIEEWRDAQPLAIDPDRLRLSDEVIGVGSFGQVLAGTLETHGRDQRVAVKMLPAMTQAEQRKQVAYVPTHTFLNTRMHKSMQSSAVCTCARARANTHTDARKQVYAHTACTYTHSSMRK